MSHKKHQKKKAFKKKGFKEEIWKGFLPLPLHFIFFCNPGIFARIFLPGNWQDGNAYTLQEYCAQ
jgi:hypothetical protein